MPRQSAVRAHWRVAEDDERVEERAGVDVLVRERGRRRATACLLGSRELNCAHARGRHIPREVGAARQASLVKSGGGSGVCGVCGGGGGGVCGSRLHLLKA
jgi:hypothetical protein